MSTKQRLLELNARLAEKLTSKGVQASANETTTTLVNKVDSIVTGGGSSGIDYMPYMASVKFSTAAEELTENISLDLSNATSIAGMFEFLNVNFKKISFKITDKCKSFQNAFRTNTNYVDKLEEIEIIGDTSGVTTFYRTFSGRKTLKKITGVLAIGSGVTTSHDTFGSCNSLEEVRFAPNCIALNISFKDSPNLSDETIDSIVNGLADMTGSTAIILTVHPNVKAKIESNSVWLNTIVGKNCTLA